MLVVCVYVWGKGCVCMYVWGEVCVKEVKMQSRAGQNMFGFHSGERGGAALFFATVGLLPTSVLPVIQVLHTAVSSPCWVWHHLVAQW
jgi:hypothetical protein